MNSDVAKSTNLTDNAPQTAGSNTERATLAMDVRIKMTISELDLTAMNWRFPN